MNDLSPRIRDAVRFFWSSRHGQQKNQEDHGKRDQGSRGSVTGGKHLDGFLDLFSELLAEAGIPRESIYIRGKRQLPGYFRPLKEWDLVVMDGDRLVTAVEAKSQVGSFGNNFNNRSEEAIGNAVDIWTAFREGRLGSSIPWIGYLMLLEDNEKSRSPVSMREGHFQVDPEFIGASYSGRYQILCRRLMLERHYSATALILSAKDETQTGDFVEPAPDLTTTKFARSMIAHAQGAFNLI